MERVFMLYRENGQFKSSYRADQQIFPIRQERWFVRGRMLSAPLEPGTEVPGAGDG